MRFYYFNKDLLQSFILPLQQISRNSTQDVTKRIKTGRIKIFISLREESFLFRFLKKQGKLFYANGNFMWKEIKTLQKREQWLDRCHIPLCTYESQIRRFKWSRFIRSSSLRHTFLNILVDFAVICKRNFRIFWIIFFHEIFVAFLTTLRLWRKSDWNESYERKTFLIRRQMLTIAVFILCYRFLIVQESEWSASDIKAFIVWNEEDEEELTVDILCHSWWFRF